MQKGFTPVVVLVIIAIISVVGLVATKKISLPLTITTPVATVAATQGSTSTPTPTTKPTPQATKAPATAVATATPAPKNIISGSPGVGYSSGAVHTEVGDFSAKILTLDLGTTKIITDTANDGDCGNGCATMSLSDFVSRNGGFGGVNGTYFCPASYAECGGKTDSFDFPVYNTRLGHWINAGNLFWNGRAIFYTDGSGAHYLQNANSFGGGLTAGIVNFPGLLSDGNVQIDENQSGLSDKQRSVGTKVGIGVVNPSKVIVVVASAVNMHQFAYVFKALGATGALNLDTGGSTALYYNGYKAGPGRALPNAIIFAPK